MTSNLLPGVDRNQIIKVVAIVLVVLGILSLCGGIGLLTAGALGGFAGLGSTALGQSGAAGTESGELAAAGAALAAVSGIAVVLGIANLVLGPLMLVAAYGLFQRKSWARMLTVVVAGVSAIISLLSILTGGGLIGNLIPLIIDAFVAYLFYTDTEIQQILSN